MENLYKCDKCGKELIYEQHLYSHIMVFHYGDGIDNGDHTSLSDSNHLNTKDTSNHLNTKDTLNHLNTKDKIISLIENRSYVSTHSMNTRRRNANTKKNYILKRQDVNINKKIFKCSLCNKIYTRRNSLNRHIFINHQ